MRGSSFLVESKAVRICESYAAHKGISLEEAIKLFFCSTTYRVLNNLETGVYLEVFEFVYDMFLEEMEDEVK